MWTAAFSLHPTTVCISGPASHSVVQVVIGPLSTLSPRPSLCSSAKRLDTLTLCNIYPVAIAPKHFWPIVTPQPNMYPHRHIRAKCINIVQTNILWNSACSFCLWCTLLSMVLYYNWVYFIFFKCQQQPTKLISGPINGLQPVLWHIKGLDLNAGVTRSIVPVSHYHPLTLCCASIRYSCNKLFWAPAACRAFSLGAKKDTNAKKYPVLPLKACLPSGALVTGNRSLFWLIWYRSYILYIVYSYNIELYSYMY